MTREEHDLETVGVYALGGLDAAHARALEEHLAGCERCRTEYEQVRQAVASLGEVPPEALLDGPPEGGDLVLQRAIGQIRGESVRGRRRRQALATAAAVLLIGTALGGGVLLGHQTAPAPGAVPIVSSPPAPAPVPGTRVASTRDPTSGALLTVQLVPATGWVRIAAAVSGIPTGQRCRLWVVPRRGPRVLAGSWLVSATGAREGTTLEGSALVAPDQVSAIQVDNTSHRTFVTVRL